jgi:hypothetical protein
MILNTPNPTPFHQLLRVLDERGRLSRTQNIDAIELKSGLSFGIPEFEDKRCKPRSRASGHVSTLAPRFLVIMQPGLPK